MFNLLWRKARDALSGGAYRVCLDRENDHIALSLFKGKKAVSFSPQLTQRYEALSMLASLVVAGPGHYVVPLAQLPQIKQLLRAVADDGVEMLVAAAVDNLQLIEPPANFAVAYSWSIGNSRIEQQPGHNATYFGDGWFVAGSYYWFVPGITAQDNHWLRQKAIEGEDIISFITTVIPGWNKRRFPYKSLLQYTPEPALAATISRVGPDSIVVEIKWVESPNRVRAIPSLPDHVTTGATVRPGISPQALPRSLRTDVRLRLRGEQIPRFLQEIWPRLERWSQGEVEQLQMQHALIQGKGQLKLIVSRADHEGIGITTAIPTFICGPVRMPARQASGLLATGKLFHRVQGGWLAATSIAQAGISASDASRHGGLSAPIVLTPTEILNRGSARLQNAWPNFDFPPVKLPQGATPLQTAYHHLHFLKSWGIPGGLVGAAGTYQKAFFTLFSTLLATHAQARILVIGAGKALDDITPFWQSNIRGRLNGNNGDPPFAPFPRGIILATPKALAAYPDLIKIEWHILCLLDADRLIRSDGSRLFQRLAQCRQMLTLGAFDSDDFLARTGAREAMSQVFGLPPYRGGEFVWRYALRDPTRPAPGLPPPYQAQPTHKQRGGHVSTAEFQVGDQSGSGALPIPPRPAKKPPEKPPQSVGAPAEPRVAIRFSTREGSFVKEARKVVNRSEKSARFVPFQQYWPTYGSMTARQQQWYFYWRSQVRKGTYPDTDLSYIFVHVYELINNIGVENKMDGYHRLRQLWLHYRERHPDLDNYLVDWLADYVVVNDCPVDPLKIYADGALENSASYRDLDLRLASYVARPFTQIPLVLIEQLTNYRIQRSKFYTGGQQQLIREYLPRTLEQVDRYLRQAGGGGIFERFKPRQSVTIRRSPFQGALYDGAAAEITLAVIAPYSRHQPLRDFLTAVAKHTENNLRELKKFRGRLRGYRLEPAVQAVIDQYIAGVAEAITPPPPKPKVEIDFVEVDRLRRESAQVFEMLQSPAEGGDEAAAPVQPAAAPFLSVATEPPLATVPAEEPAEGSNLLAPGPTDGPVAAAGQADARPGLTGSAAAQKEPLSPSPLETNQANSARERFDDGLPPEWVAFAQQLADYQRQVLTAVVTQSDPTAAIAQIAEANVKMPALLLDEVNEAAQETIGDIIISPHPLPHVSEEEYVALLHKLVGARE